MKFDRRSSSHYLKYFFSSWYQFSSIRKFINFYRNYYSAHFFSFCFRCWNFIFFIKFLKIFDFPITIAAFQCLTAALFSIIPAFAFEYVSLKVLSLEATELIYAGVLSSGIAFMFQIFALQNLSPAPAAIIFSLEGVFASIAAWFLLDQFLNEYKIFGIIIILSAVIFSQLAPMYDKRKYGRN